MRLRRVEAVAFLAEISAGRNRPILLRCEGADESSEGEFVVKLRAGLQGPPVGLAFEVLAALLARRLGLSCPEPVEVVVSEGLADATETANPEVAGRMRASVGSNFGSKYLRSLLTWGRNEPIPAKLRPPATEILAFDALMQNPDRQAHGNPNILVGSSAMYVIDHEAAFSFYYAVGGASEPWNVANLTFLREHIFFRQLRGRAASLERFRSAFESLSDDDLNEMLQQVPESWREDRLDSVVEHVRLVRNRADQFFEQLAGMLR